MHTLFLFSVHKPHVDWLGKLPCTLKYRWEDKEHWSSVKTEMCLFASVFLKMHEDMLFCHLIFYLLLCRRSPTEVKTKKKEKGVKIFHNNLLKRTINGLTSPASCSLIGCWSISTSCSPSAICTIVYFHCFLVLSFFMLVLFQLLVHPASSTICHMFDLAVKMRWFENKI